MAVATSRRHRVLPRRAVGHAPAPALDGLRPGQPLGLAAGREILAAPAPSPGGSASCSSSPPRSDSDASEASEASEASDAPPEMRAARSSSKSGASGGLSPSELIRTFFRRSGSAPAGSPPRPEWPTVAAADMRVLARGGCPRLADLTGQEVEIWSGRRWVRARVVPAPPSPVYRVRLDSGACLACGPDLKWPVVENGQIRPVAAADLRSDACVSAFMPPPAAGLGGGELPNAYEEGVVFGRRIADGVRAKESSVARLLTLAPAPLGLFVAGWMDAQHGTLFGSRELIHTLQIALQRLGVLGSQVEEIGSACTLGLTPEDGARIPNPQKRARTFSWTERACRRVVEVYQSAGDHKKACCAVVPAEPEAGAACGTFVLDGVLALFG
jgi:hypothetical protein